MNTLAFGLEFGFWQMIVIAFLAVLIWGRRLPEVGRNVGRSLFEFKRGLKEASDEFNEAQQTAKDVGNEIKTPPPAGQTPQNAGTQNASSDKNAPQA